MKKAAALLLVTALLLSFGGCFGRETPATQPSHSQTSATTTVPEETTAPATGETTAATEATTVPTDAATEPTSATTEPTVATTEPTTHYTVKIHRADFLVFNGPAYDEHSVGTVESAGTYTIVEEVTDGENNLWGKLKSGFGWIDLTLLAAEKKDMPPVTVSRPSQKLLDSGDYYYCKADFTDYSCDISFLAHEKLRDVTLFSLYDDVRGQELYRLSTWEPGKPFVATVNFQSLLSQYGLEFTDRDGKTHIYVINQSGRNGTIYMTELDRSLISAEPKMPEVLNLVFSSGAGAWSTVLTLRSDGSFQGSYSDSEMGDMGEAYPHGSCYVCDFSGQLRITGATDYAVMLQMEKLNKKDYGAAEWIEDQIRYIASDAYGIEGGTTFLLYMPNTPVDQLPGGMRGWAYQIPQTGTLGRYALYCPETESPFFAY